MKIRNILAVAVAIVALSSSSTVFAQGQVNFSSLPLDPASATGVVKDSSGSPLHTSAFVAQLWGSSTVNGTFSQISGTYSFNTVSGTPVLFGQISDSIYTVSGIAAGSSLFYQIRAWTIADGATFAAASSKAGAQVGQSATASVTLTGAPSTPPNTDNFTSFSLATVVPEPGVLALGLLGGAVLLFRRRK